MAESSILWTTDGTGDGTNSGYTMAQVTEWQRMLAAGLTGADLSGVAPDYLNELEVTGTATPVAVNTGGAIVYGYPYFNSASVNVAIPTPSASTRVDCVVLRADWTAQTVRITRIAGTEGAGAPAITQSAGTTWDCKLAEASITTGGVITVTDSREWLNTVGDLSISTAKLAADAVTGAKIADDQIDSEHYVAGSIDNEHLAANSVDSSQIASGAVDLAHMSANSVDSDQYVDGSIDPVHIGTLNVDDLDDVTITTPANDEVLTYSSGTWVNSTVSGSLATFIQATETLGNTISGTQAMNLNTLHLENDPDSELSLASNKIEIAADMFALVMFAVDFEQNANSTWGAQAWVGVNGSTPDFAMYLQNYTGGAASGSEFSVSGSMILDLANGDDLQVYCTVETGSPTTPSGKAHLAVVKLADS